MSGREEKGTKSENVGYRQLLERLGHLEKDIKTTKFLVEKLLKMVQAGQQQQVSVITQKPSCLPLSSLEEMDEFESVSDDVYKDVVEYFQYIGGFNLKEAVNCCFKEAIKDDVMTSYTWRGQEGQRPLCNAKIIMAIYEAVCRSKAFVRPTRMEFQEQMKATLRTAKERLRHRKKPKNLTARAHNFWTDDPLDVSQKEEYIVDQHEEEYDDQQELEEQQM